MKSDHPVIVLTMPAHEGSEGTRRTQALAMMTRALGAAKNAKSLGVDVRPARPLMKQCLRAFEAGDYDEAMRFAGEVLRRFAGSQESS